MSEELNSQILEGLNQGLDPQYIINELSKSSNPEHQAWVKNYRANAAQQESSIPAPSATMETPLLNAAEKTVGQAAQATNDMTLGQKMALGAAAAGAAGAAGLGGYAAKQRIDTNEELRRKRLLGEEISPAVRVQQEQLELQKRQFEASQAGGLSPLEQAKIETEQARKASLELDAEIKRSQLIEKAKAAEIAAAKRAAGIPVERPKPSVQDTAAKLGITSTTGPTPPGPGFSTADLGTANTAFGQSQTPTPPSESITPPAQASEISSAPVETITPVQQTAPETNVPKGAVPPNKRVEQAMAAVPKNVQDQFTKDNKIVLKGYGSGDVSVTNTYGKKAYASIVDYFNNGQPIGSDENYKKVQAKINRGIPPSMASDFASKLPSSEAEAGTFGSTELGEKIAYTKEGKVVRSPGAIKNALAHGGALAMVFAAPNIAFAAQEGDRNALGEMALGNIPGVGPQAGLYHSSLDVGEQEKLNYLRRMQAAKERGPGNRGQAYDPRKFYSPMAGSLDVPGIAPYR